jgi:hypothetical protein
LPDLLLPLAPDILINFRFRKATAGAVAQEIAELTESVFGLSDPELAEGWALSEAQDLSPAKLRQVLTDTNGIRD